MKPRILFVDDHEDTRTLITAMLGMYGYQVTAVDSYQQGLELAQTRSFDLYLLDSKFAEGSGAELCEKIREFDEMTPIVFYSGEHPSRLKEALECDAQGYVMKPGFDTLTAEIEQALNAAA